MSVLSWPLGRRVSRAAAALATLTGVSALGARLPAQTPVTNPNASQSWQVQSSPDLDLWFHGLAVLRYDGAGPLGMYENGYAARIRAAKAAREIAPTLLDRNAQALNRAFRRDHAFELMHFLPLYFLNPRNGNLFSGLRAVARGESLERATGDSSRKAVLAAISGVIRTDEQRRLLTKFLDALENERRVFYDEYARESPASRQAATGPAAQYWLDTVIPHIKPFLDRAGAISGVLILSPALGAEGRSIQLSGSNAGMAIVAVGLPPSAADFTLPAAAAIRELCFPIVHGVIASQPSTGMNRIMQERLTSTAAVRCGARTIEQFFPSLLISYQTLFLRAAGLSPPEPTLDAAFATAFPVSGNIDEGVRRALKSR